MSMLHQHCTRGSEYLGFPSLAAHRPWIWVPLTCFRAAVLFLQLLRGCFYSFAIPEILQSISHSFPEL